jgi:hypothetical protein
MLPFPSPSHCLLIEKAHSRTIYTHGTTNATLKSIYPTACFYILKLKRTPFPAGWDADEWAYVCARLGVSENQTERVPIKFCNPFHGCNFAKCPHTDKDDRKSLFRFPAVQKNAKLSYKPSKCVGSMQNVSKLLCYILPFLLYL